MSIPTVTSARDTGVTVRQDVGVAAPRPRALVTSPLSGAGFEKLRRHRRRRLRPVDRPAAAADLRPPSSWPSGPPHEGADVLVVEADWVKGPGARPPACWRWPPRAATPTTWTSPARTAAGMPVLNAPGRNADAVAEMAWRSSSPSTATCSGADADVRAGADLPRRHHPLSALPGVGAQRPDGRAGRPRRRGPGAASGGSRASACGSSPTTPTTPRPPTASTTCSPRPTSSRCTRRSPPRRPGMIGADQFAAMRDGAVFINTARAQLHDTDALVEALRVRQAGRRRAGPLRRRAAARPTIPWPPCPTWCSHRTSAAPRGTPRRARRR